MKFCCPYEVYWEILSLGMRFPDYQCMYPSSWWSTDTVYHSLLVTREWEIPSNPFQTLCKKSIFKRKSFGRRGGSWKMWLLLLVQAFRLTTAANMNGGGVRSFLCDRKIYLCIWCFGNFNWKFSKFRLLKLRSLWKYLLSRCLMPLATRPVLRPIGKMIVGQPCSPPCYCWPTYLTIVGRHHLLLMPRVIFTSKQLLKIW